MIRSLHQRHDDPLQQNEPERPDHADGGHAEERVLSPVTLLHEHPRQHEAADDERCGHANVDQAIGLGPEVRPPDPAGVKQEEPLRHEHRPWQDDRDERRVLPARRDRRTARAHDGSGDERHYRPHDVQLADRVVAGSGAGVVRRDAHDERDRAGERALPRRRRPVPDDESRERPRRRDAPQEREQPTGQGPVREQ